MSGICGGWVCDPDRLSLPNMLDGIAYRGPDGTSKWQSDGVGLGHAHLRCDAKAVAGPSLFHHAPSDCVITAHARLDNREELGSALNLNAETISEKSDAKLILLAYLQFGKACPSKLLGDFAFAIWDSRSKCFFCARDHMGMKPFFYTLTPNGGFLFASDFEALFAHPLVVRKINRLKVNDFLEDREGRDSTSTFHPDIFRLAPAHSISWNGDRLCVSRYWELRAPPPLEMDSDDEYRAAFLSVFEQAVRCRLPRDRNAATMLSGGVDSGAVSTVAAEIFENEGLKLPTITALGPHANEETRRATLSAASPLFEPLYVRTDSLGWMLPNLRSLFENCRDPFDCTMAMIQSVYLAAKSKGIRIVLDGGGGDLAFISGNLAAQAASKGRFDEAWKIIQKRRVASRDNRSFAIQFCRSIAAAWAPQLLRVAFESLRTWMRPHRQIPHFSFDDSSACLTASQLRKTSNAKRSVEHHRPYGVSYRIARLTDANAIVGNERYERAAASLHIDARDPFMDIRLIKFCLSLPNDQLERDGWPKFLLRRAMTGKLPDAVLWTPGKHTFGPAFTRSVVAGWPKFDARRASLRGSEWQVSFPRTTPTPSRALSKNEMVRLVALSFWLERLYRGASSFARSSHVADPP